MPVRTLLSFLPARLLRANLITAPPAPPSPRAPSCGSDRGRSRTISPSARKRIRSAIAAARASCVTITVVWPYSSTESRISVRISPPVAESRLPVGSSANSTVGRETSARAIATRCCWPPESSEGRCVSRSPRPTLAIRSSNQALSTFSPRSRAADDVLLRGQHRQQVEELEDEADVRAPQLGQVGVLQRRDLRARDLDRAGGRLVEPGHDVHQRRLARSPTAPSRRSACPGRPRARRPSARRLRCRLLRSGA